MKQTVITLQCNVALSKRIFGVDVFFKNDVTWSKQINKG